MSNHFSAHPTSTKKILDYARIVRQGAHVSKKLFFPVVEFLEHFIPKFDEDFNLRILEEQEMPRNTYAYYDPVSNTMSIREDVYDGACANNHRDRFTIAHEIGHFFLHHKGFALYRESEERVIPTYCDPEWQANTFAGFLLMPPELICDLTSEEISKKCGTSMAAARIAKRKSQTLR